MLFDIPTRGQLQPHLQREWLLTNGLGGFASSTLVGCNTRRYHGLLCAATLPPVGRVMALNRLAEIVVLDGARDRMLELSVNRFGEHVHPQGHTFLQRFEMDDLVRWTYDVEGVRIVKELQVPWMRNVVGVRYTVESPRDRRVDLQLLPFVSLRDFHATLHANAVSFLTRTDDRAVSVGQGAHVVHVTCDGGVDARFGRAEAWWYDHTYPVETERGLDDREDLFTPGRFVATFPQGRGSVTLWASLDEPVRLDWEGELAQRREAVAAACCIADNVAPAAHDPSVLPEPAPEQAGAASSDTIRKLARAANDFVVYRKTPDGRDGTSVIAGYPWFADWGRDTFIALPGLLLTTRRFAQARQVLEVFAQYISEGMIPNKFDDYNNEPHYNTVDASLWFVHAAHEYLRLSEDRATFDRVLLPGCRAIIDGYRTGTRFNIRMDESDGLITQGDANTQLTWMDARHGGVSFTPRQGKAVEINALWHNALVLLGENDLAAKVRESFRAAFWISPFRGLADVVGEDGSRDARIRPNQIFAASLPHGPLDRDERSAVVEVVRRELLTPYGLRTLAASDPGYCPRYTGPQSQRDAAYHNGTIWTWPMGAFLEAYLNVHDRSAESIGQVREWIAPLVRHMNEDACIGQINEIFEAEPPHRPVGCCAQAWSVAEVLRIAVEVGM